MAAEENKAVIRRLVEEFWNEGNTQVFDDVFADDTRIAGQLLAHGVIGLGPAKAGPYGDSAMSRVVSRFSRTCREQQRDS